MKLYHGTSLEHLRGISNDGGMVPQKGRGDGQVDRDADVSKFEGYTFLATTEDQAKNYAQNRLWENEGNVYLTIIEIEMEEELLLPDNDDLDDAKTWQESAEELEQVKVQGGIPKEKITNVRMYDNDENIIFEGPFENWEEKFDQLRFESKDFQDKWYKFVTTSDQLNNFSIDRNVPRVFETTSVPILNEINLKNTTRSENAVKEIKELLKENASSFPTVYTSKFPLKTKSKETLDFEKLINSPFEYDTDKKLVLSAIQDERIKGFLEEKTIEVPIDHIIYRTKKEIYLHKAKDVSSVVDKVETNDSALSFPVEIEVMLEEFHEKFYKDDTTSISENLIKTTSSLDLTCFKTAKFHPETNFRSYESFQNHDEFMDFANDYLHFGKIKPEQEITDRIDYFQRQFEERERSYIKDQVIPLELLGSKELNKLENERLLNINWESEKVLNFSDKKVNISILSEESDKYLQTMFSDKLLTTIENSKKVHEKMVKKEPVLLKKESELEI